MKKKKLGFNMPGNVAILEPCTARQFVRHATVALAQNEFADLGDSDLAAARELWEVKAAFEALLELYRASMGQECQRVVLRIEKFRRKHNL
jgi:hypothetical protein